MDYGKWSIQETRNLIKAVRHYSFIYDVTDVRNVDKMCVRNTWEVISKVIGSKKDKECRKKWESLKCHFKRCDEHRQATQTTPTWIHYSNLGFLLPFIHEQRHYDVDPNAIYLTMSQQPDIPKPKVADCSADEMASIPKLEHDKHLNEEYLDIIEEDLDASNRNAELENQLRAATYERLNDEADSMQNESKEIQSPPLQYHHMQESSTDGNVKPTAFTIDMASPGSTSADNDINETFFKMIAIEMQKLSAKKQSEYRISVLTKLHEMLFSNVAVSEP